MIGCNIEFRPHAKVPLRLGRRIRLGFLGCVSNSSVDYCIGLRICKFIIYECKLSASAGLADLLDQKISKRCRNTGAGDKNSEQLYFEISVVGRVQGQDEGKAIRALDQAPRYCNAKGA